MVTAEVVQYYHSPPLPHMIGEFDIRPKNLVDGVTASYLQSSIRDLGLELSSPEANYNAKLKHGSNGKQLVQVQHKKTDGERRKIAKERIATLEERLTKLEEAEKQRQENAKKQEEAEKQRQENAKKQEEAEKQRQENAKKQEETIFIWETCDRIVQAIDDFLKRAIQWSVQDLHTNQPDLREAAYILSGKATYHYLPVLFTIWWIHWNRINPIVYPLPPALSSLRSLQPTRYNPEPLPFDLERTAWILWHSRYRPLIEVMLATYHAKPKERNMIQHDPTPSTQFALGFIHSSHLNLPAQSKQLVSAVINLGISPRARDYTHLFSHPAGEITFSNLDQLDGEIEAILE